MKQFLANLNFPRSVILVSTLAVLVLGWFGWKASLRLAALEDQTDVERGEAQKLVTQIQVAGLQLQQLVSQADREGLGVLSDPDFYIKSIAAQPDVKLGQVDVDPVKERAVSTGVIDKPFIIKPSDSARGFARGAIANFLYRLEEKSRRVRVTKVHIAPQGKVKPGDIGPDSWTFDAEITSREPVEGATAAPAAGAAPGGAGGGAPAGS